MVCYIYATTVHNFKSSIHTVLHKSDKDCDLKFSLNFKVASLDSGVQTNIYSQKTEPPSIASKVEPVSCEAMLLK